MYHKQIKSTVLFRKRIRIPTYTIG